jgi:hypothetical protein
VVLPSWMELAAAEPFDEDLRLGSDAEQGPGMSMRTLGDDVSRKDAVASSWAPRI